MYAPLLTTQITIRNAQMIGLEQNQVCLIIDLIPDDTTSLLLASNGVIVTNF